MTEITVKVPETQLVFFSELINKLGFKTMKKGKEEDFVVPEFHKKIIRERMKTFKKEDCKDWDDIKHTI